MSHLESSRPSPSRDPVMPARGSHRCLVDDVLRGMWRQSGGEGRSPPAVGRARRSPPAAVGGSVGPDSRAARRPPRPGAAPEVEPGVVRIPVPTRGEGLGWVLEIGLVLGQVLSEEHWRAIRRGLGVWELAAEFDRKGGALPRLLHAHNRVRDGAAPLIGSSPAMCHLRERIERVAATDFTVLIEGESGSGKELVARQIHDLSARRRNPFVALNCAAIVDTLLEAELFGIEDRTATGVRGRRGKFEHATGGTLFLDEVADLSPSAQAKLLRAIQERVVERVGADAGHAVDIRLVVATNRPLRDLVQQGEFRSDLFYRLSGVELKVPPLRSRREDILELARYFLVRHGGARALSLSAPSENALFSYNWPGNVRELERMMESAVVLAKGQLVELQDLSGEVRADFAEVLTLRFEKGTRFANGAPATSSSSCTGAATTSGRHAARWTSATTRCRRTRGNPGPSGGKHDASASCRGLAGAAARPAGARAGAGGGSTPNDRGPLRVVGDAGVRNEVGPRGGARAILPGASGNASARQAACAWRRGGVARRGGRPSRQRPGRPAGGCVVSSLRVAGVCVMGWVLTASGSLAGPIEFLDRPSASGPQSEPRRIERAEVVDVGTGAELRLTARPGGALRASLTWSDLDATKIVQPNGDFHARIAGRRDVLVLVRTGNRLRVTRGGQTAVLVLDGADEDGLDLVQMVLAGSHAARAFRGVHRRLSQESRESAPGVALDNLDMLLAILQGETGAVDRRAPVRREAGWQVCAPLAVPALPATPITRGRSSPRGTTSRSAWTT